MKSYQGIISLNSSEQNEKMAWYCLEHSEIERFKQLLANEMPLTGFMLNTMVLFKYSDTTIKEVLKLAKKYEQIVPQWMQHYFAVSELDEILPQYQEQLPKDWPSDEDCIRLKLWKALYNRKYEIAKFAPDVALMMHLDAELLQVNFAKFAPIYFEKKRYSLFLKGKDHWKYLVDNGKVGWLLYFKAQCNLFPWDEVIAYCMQKGLDDELYDAECYDALLSHGRTEVFVKNHSGYSGFLSQYPELVDWEYLWKNNQLSHDYLIEQALKNRNTPNNHEFLKRHAGIWQILFG